MYNSIPRPAVILYERNKNLMITINKDRKAYIPESDRFIGYENDNLVETRLFEICDDELSDFHFKLDIAETLDIIDLEKTTLNGEKTVLLWKISSAAIGKGGVIRVQLRAFDSEGNKVWHSQVMDFIARESINAQKNSDEEHILSEFEQIEIRATNAASVAQQYATNAEASATQSYDFSVQAENAAKSSEEHCHNAGTYSEQAKAYAETVQTDKNEINATKIDADIAKQFAEKCASQASESASSAKNSEVSAKEHKDSAKVLVGEAASYADAAESSKNYTIALTNSLSKQLLNEKDFKLTDFGYVTSSTEYINISDNQIDATMIHAPILIQCSDKTLSFKCNARSTNNKISLKYNGVTHEYFNPNFSQGEVLDIDIVVPPMYMETDIEVEGCLTIWTFSEMKEYTNPIDNLETALDAILAIQEELMDIIVLLPDGEPEEVPLGGES